MKYKSFILNLNFTKLIISILHFHIATHTFIYLEPYIDSNNWLFSKILILIEINELYFSTINFNKCRFILSVKIKGNLFLFLLWLPIYFHRMIGMIICIMTFLLLYFPSLTGLTHPQTSLFTYDNCSVAFSPSVNLSTQR